MSKVANTGIYDIYDCKHCGRRVRQTHGAIIGKLRWVHHWSFKDSCGAGRSTFAEPQDEPRPE